MKQAETVSAYANLLMPEQWRALRDNFHGVQITGPFKCFLETCDTEEMHINVPDWQILAEVEIAIRKQSPPETKNQPFFPHG